jgi:GNAT superfamily N-acetyltransferase
LPHLKKIKSFGIGDHIEGIEDTLKSKFDDLSPGAQSKIKTFHKGAIGAFNKVQMPVQMADFGLKATGLGGSKEVDAMQRQSSIIKGINNSMQPQKHVGALGDMFKEGSLDFEKRLEDLYHRRHGNEPIINLRPPSSVYEQPWLADICKELADIFLIGTKKDEEMLNDRIFTQNTLMSGELDDLHGFINFGNRSFGMGKPKIKYIRVVYVNPEYRGHGIANKFVSSVLDEGEPAWMQISHTNSPMIKMASRMGFKHFDTWHYDGHESQLWGINLPGKYDR